MDQDVGSGGQHSENAPIPDFSLDIAYSDWGFSYISLSSVKKKIFTVASFNVLSNSSS
jgi:hypothetical protein